MRSPIEGVARQMERKLIVADIKRRFELYGVAPQCQGCKEQCAQSANPFHNTAFECWKRPGPLHHIFWRKRRLSGAKKRNLSDGGSAYPGRVVAPNIRPASQPKEDHREQQA